MSARSSSDAAPAGRHAVPPPRRWRIRITWTIALLFTGLNVLGIGAVLAIGLRAATENTDALILDRLGDAIDTAAGRVTLILQPVAAQAAEIADALRAGRIDPEVPELLRTYLAGTLATTPQVLGLALADTNLRFEAFTRYDEAGAVRGLPNVVTIAAAVDWARTADGQRWLHGWSPAVGQSIVMLQTPLHVRERFYGVLTSAVTLRDLHESVRRVAQQVGQPVFILYRRDFVVAASSGLPGFTPSPQQPLATLAQSGDPLLARMWDASAVAMPTDELIANVRGHRLATPEGAVTFIYRPLGNGDYAVGTYFRGSLAAAEVARLRNMAIAGAAVLVLSLLLTVVFGRRVGRPVRRLAHAAGVIERQRYEAFQPLPTSPIREIDEAARAFNQMVEGLKERQRIRDLFGKYVPNEVVDQLIAEPGAFGAGGERREISLLFSDIAGFTTLAEGMKPVEVLRLLNAYLEEVCATVHAHDGVIVDFIGDAVFAIFGAPIARPDHARRAIACVRDMDRVASAFAAERNAEGIAFGATRIGVHTGVATVGNFGSSDRLKYSAAGDIVNTTSRLEGANKYFGTRLLASRLVVDAAGDRDWRPLGRLVLKGRSAELAVVECLPPELAAQDWVEAYRRAYALIEQGSAEAEPALRALAAARPDDSVVRFHLARIERGLISAVIEMAEK